MVAYSFGFNVDYGVPAGLKVTTCSSTTTTHTVGSIAAASSAPPMTKTPDRSRASCHRPSEDRGGQRLDVPEAAKAAAPA